MSGTDCPALLEDLDAALNAEQQSTGRDGSASGASNEAAEAANGRVVEAMQRVLETEGCIPQPMAWYHDLGKRLERKGWRDPSVIPVRLH